MSQARHIPEQQATVLMEKEIGLRMEVLIPKMQEMAKDYNLRAERSPFRNVLNVSTNAASGIEITKNFIRYQLGRSEAKQSGANRMWSNTVRGKKFAVALVEAIDNLRGEAKVVVERMDAHLDTKLDNTWLHRVHVRLMQLYLGNLVRYQVFLANEGRRK